MPGATATLEVGDHGAISLSARQHPVRTAARGHEFTIDYLSSVGSQIGRARLLRSHSCPVHGLSRDPRLSRGGSGRCWVIGFRTERPRALKSQRTGSMRSYR